MEDTVTSYASEDALGNAADANFAVGYLGGALTSALASLNRGDLDQLRDALESAAEIWQAHQGYLRTQIERLSP